MNKEAKESHYNWRSEPATIYGIPVLHHHYHRRRHLHCHKQEYNKS